MYKLILFYLAELVLSVVWLNKHDDGAIYEIIMIVIFGLVSVLFKPIMTIVKNAKPSSDANGTGLLYSIILIALRVLNLLSVIALTVCRTILSLSPAFLFAVKDKVVGAHLFFGVWCLVLFAVNLGFSFGIQLSVKNVKKFTIIAAVLSAIGIYYMLSGSMAEHLFSLSNTAVDLTIFEMVCDPVSFCLIGYLLFRIFKPRSLETELVP